MVAPHEHGVQHGLNVLSRSMHECVEHEGVEQMPVSMQQSASGKCQKLQVQSSATLTLAPTVKATQSETMLHSHIMQT